MPVDRGKAIVQMKVKVRKKDMLRVISQADEYTRWGTSSWKARQRLIKAAIGGVVELEEDPRHRDLYDYCSIPDCGCPGDYSHP